MKGIFLSMENPDSNAVILGKNLKRLRKSRKLTLVDLEVVTGINNGEISRLERGLKNVELVTLTKLAEALKAEVYEFFLPEELVSVVMENVAEYRKKDKQ
jgi:transcriptional regulator with XRE-family HTH domain